MAPPRPYRSGPGSLSHQAHVLQRPVRPHRTAARTEQGRAVAVANSMLFTIWHLLTNGAFYEDLGADYFECRHDPAVEAKRLARRIEALGFNVDLTQRAA